MNKLLGVYFKKIFDPPLKIGVDGESLEEVTLFPTDEADSFIDVRVVEGKEKITIDFNDKQWSGTMKELSEKLFN